MLESCCIGANNFFLLFYLAGVCAPSFAPGQALFPPRRQQTMMRRRRPMTCCTWRSKTVQTTPTIIMCWEMRRPLAEGLLATWDITTPLRCIPLRVSQSHCTAQRIMGPRAGGEKQFDSIVVSFRIDRHPRRALPGPLCFGLFGQRPLAQSSPATFESSTQTRSPPQTTGSRSKVSVVAASSSAERSFCSSHGGQGGGGSRLGRSRGGERGRCR